MTIQVTRRNRKASGALRAGAAALGVLCAAAGALAVPSDGSEEILFSIDAGSDRSLSDPRTPGSLDSSDAYSSHRPLSPVPIDDAVFLGGDVAPDPSTPGSEVPFDCPSGMFPFCYASYFDMDAIDVINVRLEDTVHWFDPDEPVAERIKRSDLASEERRCIWRDEFVAVSFDDDDARGWGEPASESAAPTGSASPGGGTFGTSSARDEVLALVLQHVGSASPSLPSHRIVGIWGAASERELHPGLARNPGAGQHRDDDVDALDVQGTETSCWVLLFSPDHEARHSLNPSSIYQFDGSTLSEAIRWEVHLHAGAHEDGDASNDHPDIDAFELVWIDDSGVETLAALFSVDADDPITPEDESGGLSPGALYGSFLDGSYFEVVSVSGTEDVDAIAGSPTHLRTWAEGGQPDDPH